MDPAGSIRRADSSDRATVLALWRADDVTRSPTDDGEALERLLAAPHAALLVAVVERQVIGTVIAAWDGWRGNIYRLAVDPGHRRRGIGRALVGAAHDVLAGLGARRVSALVERDHAWAVGFWDALGETGYERDARMVRYVTGVDQRSTASTP
jgi:ribosomal protein S18 acetylase RimI-like enzyme